MLSSVLRSDIAIDMSVKITRAFVAMRTMLISSSLPAKLNELEANINALREDVNEILAIQNDINEDTRAQIEAISTALAELQPKEPKSRRRIGFVQED